MKIIQNFDFNKYNIIENGNLSIFSESKDVTNYESFILENPISDNTFPKFDEPYYSSLEYSLRHLLYKFDTGWITSERQVMHSTDECISNVHFIYDNNNNVVRVNVFQRSSNLNNLKDDVQFINYFKQKYLNEFVDVTILISIPHVFRNKIYKI